MRISNITHEEYDEDLCKDLFNTKQAALYCKFGCQLIDWYYEEDVNTLVHVVLKDDTFRKVHNAFCLKKLSTMTLEDFEKWR